MGLKKIIQTTPKQEESRDHKILSALRFLKNLHKEIELAEKLEDIKDPVILNKFAQHIKSLEEEFI